MKSRMNSIMGLKLLCVTDKRDTLVALSQKSENLSRLKTKAPWINFCGAFAIFAIHKKFSCAHSCGL